jgi:hypothetical protein
LQEPVLCLCLSWFVIPDRRSPAPAQLIKTIPGKGWFVYFRIYGPEQAAFDGSWKPGDFEQVGNLRVQS